MAFFIKFDKDNQIELPTELNLEERIKLCQEITDKYPEYFEVKMPENNKDMNIAGNKASLRLEIMGSYILAGADNDKDYPTLTQYKQDMIKESECSLEELNKD